MPDLAGLKILENWHEAEHGMGRRLRRGLVLLALGLGGYFAVIASARLILAPGNKALASLDYMLVHLLLYFPLPFIYAMGGRERAAREIACWMLAALVPAALGALIRGGFTPPGRFGFFLRQVLHPLGLGFWLTLLFGFRWRGLFPDALIELGVPLFKARSHLLHAGAGAAAAVALLLHLCLTRLLAGYTFLEYAGLGAVWGIGGFAAAWESLGEELFFRGFLYQYLQRRHWPFWPAALLVAGLDSARRLAQPGAAAGLAATIVLVFYVFIYAVVNCALLARTRNLLAPWVANLLFAAGVAIFRLAI